MKHFGVRLCRGTSSRCLRRGAGAIFMSYLLVTFPLAFLKVSVVLSSLSLHPPRHPVAPPLVALARPAASLSFWCGLICFIPQHPSHPSYAQSLARVLSVLCAKLCVCVCVRARACTHKHTHYTIECESARSRSNPRSRSRCITLVHVLALSLAPSLLSSLALSLTPNPSTSPSPPHPPCLLT